MSKTKEKVTRLLAVVMSAMLVLSLTAAGAFAAQEGELTGGSITIDNAVSGQTYSVYQILYLESYDAASNAYAYKANSAWADWLKTQTSYVSIDAQGYVTWVSGASVADFAKAAQAEATKQNGTITADKTEVASEPKEGQNKSTVSFTGLKLGYYLVDSTMGTLCSLDTTNPDVTIQEKNMAPTNEKEVLEGTSWDSSNDANIGDTVKFQSTITAQAGAQNYVFHDKMDAGLTFGGSVKVTLNNQEVRAEVKNDDTTVTNYTFKDYTAAGATTPTDGCTFEVAFTKNFCDTLKANDKIVISYTATVNENAVVGSDGNKNESKVEYGEDGGFSTTPSETTTYTYQFDLVKTKIDNTLLTGAKFKLYDAKTGGNEIALVKTSDGVYRVATAAEKSAEGFTAATIEAGKAVIKGLDSGTYYLEEITAPAGYNKLAERIEVTINKANLDATVNEETNTWTAGGVHVTNQTGNELPSTGGMGTTVLYVVGGILVVGAGVALVVRRRTGGAE